MTETVSILHQGLQALEYLHSHQMDRTRIAHRDIKPANVLVVSRSPFLIKLADFGLAQDRSDLVTHCGTFFYAAPEVHERKPYTTAVDIWSLGVVVFQYAYGLPEEAPQRGPQRSMRGRARAWCQQLVDEVNHGDSHPLKDLLSAYMLRMEPLQRLSADQCFDALRPFHDLIFESGNVTPTTMTSVMSDDGDSTTIILGALWAAQETSSVRDNSRNTYNGAQHTAGFLELPTAQDPRGTNHFPFDSFRPAGEQLAGSVEAPVDFCAVPGEAQATYPTNYKPQWTQTIVSSKRSSIRRRSKR